MRVKRKSEDDAEEEGEGEEEEGGCGGCGEHPLALLVLLLLVPIYRLSIVDLSYAPFYSKKTKNILLTYDYMRSRKGPGGMASP